MQALFFTPPHSYSATTSCRSQTATPDSRPSGARWILSTRAFTQYESIRMATKSRYSRASPSPTAPATAGGAWSASGAATARSAPGESRVAGGASAGAGGSVPGVAGLPSQARSAEEQTLALCPRFHPRCHKQDLANRARAPTHPGTTGHRRDSQKHLGQMCVQLTGEHATAPLRSADSCTGTSSHEGSVITPQPQSTRAEVAVSLLTFAGGSLTSLFGGAIYALCPPSSGNQQIQQAWLTFVMTMGTSNTVKVTALAVPQPGPCGSSARAWRLWAAQYSLSEAQPLGARPPPRGLTGAASKVADSAAFDLVGTNSSGPSSVWRSRPTSLRSWATSRATSTRSRTATAS